MCQFGFCLLRPGVPFPMAVESKSSPLVKLDLVTLIIAGVLAVSLVAMVVAAVHLRKECKCQFI